MANIVVGTQTPVQQPNSYGWRNGRGGYTKQRWRVTNQSDLSGLISQILAAGGSYDVSEQADGAIFLVEATFDTDANDGSGGSPTATILSEIWERDVAMTEKDILASDVAAVRDISETEKTSIRKWISTPDDNSSPPLTDANAIDVYLHMLAGVKTVRVYSPVIRRTRITANSYAVVTSDTNVGKILSQAQMTSLENAPGTILFELPDSTFTGTDFDARYGFYKKPARVTQQGDGKWQIVQEYDYDYWSELLYEDAT